MDDVTLNCEANNIKHWVTSYGHSITQAVPEEMFSDDLAALKLRLRSMEASLGVLNASHSQREAAHVQPGFAHAAGSLPSVLDSRPLFGQVFTSLRTDVQGLNSRMAEVEQHLSHLEDHVDSLDPNLFTPPGTTTCTSGPRAADEVSAYLVQQTLEQKCDARFKRYVPAWDSPVWKPRQCSQLRDESPGSAQRSGGVGVPSWRGTSASTAYRDREIARLEDILNRMQNDAQDSEDLLDSKNSHIYQLTRQQDRLHDQIAELQQTIRAYNNIFAMNRQEFERQQADFREKAAQVISLERQIHELQHGISRAGSSRQLVTETRDDLCKLQEIADRKDEVVSRQGEIIARGAALIQERDDAIQHLTKELKISIDDCRNESRERERSSRLMEERIDDIVHLRNALSRATGSDSPSNPPRADITSSHVAPEPPDEALTTPITPFAFDAQQDYRKQSGRWTPQTLRNYAKLPHEQQRATAWNTGSSVLDIGKFGQAGEISRRRSDSLKLFKRLALVEAGKGTVSQTAAGHLKPRYKLTLDSVELSGPMSETPPALPPCPSTPRNDADAGHLPGLSSRRRHVYYKEPRHSLQAYVEEEDTRRKRNDTA